MSALIIKLADYRLSPPIPIGLSVNPSTDGTIIIGMRPKNGSAYRIVLTVEEAKRHVLECQDAIELVEGVLR